MRSLGRARVPLVLLAVVLTVSIVPSSQALVFTADRAVGLDVTDDQNGIVGVDQTAVITKGATDTPLVNITNPASESVTLRVVIDGGDWSFAPQGGQTVAASGTQETLTVTVPAGDTTSVRVNVDKNAAKGIREYDIGVEGPAYDWRRLASVEIAAGNGNGKTDGTPPNIDGFAASQDANGVVVDYNVSDPDGDLKRVTIEVEYTKNGNTKTTTERINVGGGSVSGTSTIDVKGNDATRVRITVEDDGKSTVTDERAL